MSEVAILYYGNDMVLELTDLTNEVTGSNISGATVFVTLVDSSDTQVAGGTWPKPMPYVTGSDGVYRTTLEDTLSLTKGSRYTAKITADGGSGLMGYWEKRFICKVRD